MASGGIRPYILLLALGAHAQRGLRWLGLCVCVCVCVCLLSHISPLERLFVLKLLSRTERTTEVKKYVGFSLKPLPSKVMALFAHLWHPTAILQRYSAQHFDGRAF